MFGLRRYYFVVEEDNTPLSVTVTPCDAPLEWKLTLQELPEDASGEGSGKGWHVMTNYTAHSYNNQPTFCFWNGILYEENVCSLDKIVRTLKVMYWKNLL